MKKFRIALGLSLLVLLGSLTVVAQVPEIAEHYRRSYVLEAQAKPAEALTELVQIRSKAGPSYFVHARTAWLAYLSGRYDVAESQYREAALLKPKAVEPLLGMTLVLMAQSKWRELERASVEVLKLDPKNAAARARLAHAYYSIGNYPDAATVYRELVEEYPGNLAHQTGLGWALARMGRLADAKVLFGEVLAVSPDNPHALQGMAIQ